MNVCKPSMMGLTSLLATVALASPPDTGAHNPGGLPSGTASKSESFVAHEWGTFLTMNGADGVVLDSMFHEEHRLPDFVHTATPEMLRQQETVTKLETPVIYFYTDKRRTVEVTACFPTGNWTHWFPQAAWERYTMPLAAPDANGKRDRHWSRLQWNVELVPASAGRADLLPATSPNALWNYARQVDAAYVRLAAKGNKNDENSDGSPTGSRSKSGHGEWERYIFYRGLGKARLPLQFSAPDGGTISLGSDYASPLTHLFVLRVEGGRGAFRAISELKPGQRLDHVIPDMKNAEPVSVFSAHVGNLAVEGLEAGGLYRKEAQAMVNTWRNSYFESDGVRVLYVLPQAWTEKFIPLRISPNPDRLVRVMVGRTELLTPERERKVTRAVAAINSPNATTRQQSLDVLKAQGRYIEPILRRLSRVSHDPAVRSGCKTLLKADWVNRLRAPIPVVAQNR